MEISSILIGIILLVAALAYVSLPFRQTRRIGLKRHKVNTSEGQREAVFSALRDLEFDFKTGKVSEEDYVPLKAQLMTEAARYIAQGKTEDEKLEALIQTRRAAQLQVINCDRCGTPMEAGQRFCTKCGSAVSLDVCPSCGGKIRAGDQFCSLCGSNLRVAVEAVVQS